MKNEDHDRERLLYTQLSVGLEWRKKYAMLVTVSNCFSHHRVLIFLLIGIFFFFCFFAHLTEVGEG